MPVVIADEFSTMYTSILHKLLKSGVAALVKSVQSTLSHLQSPPKQMKSQRNYGSFLLKLYLHGMILSTMLSQNRPKSKRQCLNRAICYFNIVSIKQGEATEICLRSHGKCEY